jgi:hypothetical protein
MSDANSHEFMVTRLGELERRLVEVSDEAKRRKLAARKLEKELEGVRAERDEMAREREALRSTPSEWQQKAEDLERQLRSRDHRDAWREAIGLELAEKASVEDVWAKLKYEPGDQVPTADQIREQAKAARDAAPYLFSEGRGGGTSAPVGAQQALEGNGQRLLSVPLDVSRGVRDTGIGRMVVRESDMRDVGFMMSNTKALAEASKAGNLTILPG